MDEERLRQILNEELNSRRTISDEEHSDQHAWLRRWIERERRKELRWDRIRTQVTGWSIIAALSAIGAAVYNFFFRHGSGG